MLALFARFVRAHAKRRERLAEKRLQKRIADSGVEN
jgi:hypothetical protein